MIAYNRGYGYEVHALASLSIIILLLQVACNVQWIFKFFFQKYVSQHGLQGGWDDYDHGSFLKIRNRFKVMCFRTACKPTLLVLDVVER